MGRGKYKELLKGISTLMEESKFIGGEEVINFQKAFSAFNKSKYCIGVANGTDALEIAIEALNLPKGSEIIVPNFTFLSPAEAVIRSGYKLVLADINLEDYTISIESIERCITNKTRAIIVVHLFGNPCDMDEILKISKIYNLKIIEEQHL